MDEGEGERGLVYADSRDSYIQTCLLHKQRHVTYGSTRCCSGLRIAPHQARSSGSCLSTGHEDTRRGVASLSCLPLLPLLSLSGERVLRWEEVIVMEDMSGSCM